MKKRLTLSSWESNGYILQIAFVTIGKIIPGDQIQIFSLVTETKTLVALTDAEIQDLGQSTINLSKKWIAGFK